MRKFYFITRGNAGVGLIQRKPRALQEADLAFELASSAEELGDVSHGGPHPLSLSFLSGKVGAGLPRREVGVILWWDEGAWEPEAVTTLPDCRILTAERSLSMLPSRSCRPERVNDFPKVTQPAHSEARKRSQSRMCAWLSRVQDWVLLSGFSKCYPPTSSKGITGEGGEDECRDGRPL